MRLIGRFCILFDAGDIGLLRKDLAATLMWFKVDRYQISRKILRMNKRVEKEFGGEMEDGYS